MVVSLAGFIARNILHIDGAMCGSLISVEGGAAFADVIEEPHSAGW
jgi:hypothetical protein